MTEATINILLGGLLGLVGGFFSVPVNTYLLLKLKRDEQYYQHKLDMVAKERELLLQHRLEMKRKENDNSEVSELKNKLADLEIIIRRLEQATVKDE